MKRLEVISKAAIDRRAYWVGEIAKISGHFGEDTSRVVGELASEIDRDGMGALLDHLRLCGSIPEHYGHDSSEEKLYSKYTDAILSAAFNYIGLTSIVIGERADTADIEAVGKDYSLVGDAKVFRLSRTAKNQKDFKIEAIAGWKRGKPHAIVVCPIYQLPVRTSQIYQQAIVRSVSIFSYSHLAVLVRFSDERGKGAAQRLLLKALKAAETLNPSKDSVVYWTCVNRAMLSFDKAVSRLWHAEKIAMVEGLNVVKEEALTFLAKEREQILKMTRKQAIEHLVTDRNIVGRQKVIQALADNGILSMV